MPLHRRIEDVAARLRAYGGAEDAVDFYASETWFANFAATCLDPHDRLSVHEIPAGPGAAVTLVMRERQEHWRGLRWRALASATNFYTCRFAPLGLARAADPAGLIAGWAGDLRRSRDRPARLWFQALDAPCPATTALIAGLRRAGYRVEVYRQFGNWYLPLAGLDFARYWAARPSRLRNTTDRKERALRRERAVDIAILTRPDEAPRAIESYDSVAGRSWKAAEPYPGFMPGLIRTGLATGAAAVGVLTVDGEPAAAQLWVTGGRRSTIFKLNYSEAHRPLSVGTILTRHMMRWAIERGQIDEVDFGCGDDPYKQEWLPLRRQRWTVAAYDPGTPAGLALAARNLLPRLLRRRPFIDPEALGEAADGRPAAPAGAGAA